MFFRISYVKIKCFYRVTPRPQRENAEPSVIWGDFSTASYSSSAFPVVCVLWESSVLTWPNENIGNNMLPLHVPLIMYLQLDSRRPL